MRAPRSRSSRVLAIAFAAGLGLLIAAPGVTAAQPLAVKHTKVVRDAKPMPQATAAKKKKGKRKGRATTETAAVPFAQGTAAGATAACGGKSHIMGGGFAVSPPLSPSPLGGIRSTSVVSFPADNKEWTASASAFTTPPGSGTFTAYARCESNRLGRTIQLSLSGTVPQGQVTTALLDCPGPTHAVGGGYAGTPPASLSLADDAGLRTFIFESRRRNIDQWAVTAYTRNNSPVPAPFTGYVICERDGKGRNVTQASTIAPIADNGRTAGDPRCGGKRHVVSGGWSIVDADTTIAPAALFDESHPVGKKGWHVGMWEHPLLDLPSGGATLESFAYCKRIPGAKKRKKK
jgi:hypothetical protein